MHTVRAMAAVRRWRLTGRLPGWPAPAALTPDEAVVLRAVHHHGELTLTALLRTVSCGSRAGDCAALGAVRSLLRRDLLRKVRGGRRGVLAVSPAGLEALAGRR